MLILFGNGRRPAVARLGVLAACILLLGGCGPRKVEVPEATPMVVAEEEDRRELYLQALEDDGLPLSSLELKALLSEGEVDRGLSPEEMREVQVYFKHYVHAARPIIERFLLRSQPYMDYARKVFRDRGMPEELACLAFVESGFNPVAVSRSNAVGMWQFMAATGRQYGLVQDWWMDERRDPYRATHAAADYLAKLYGDFQDWHLAVAAYNAGEGKIGRALEGTRTETFFELCRNNCLLDEKRQLKEETRQYVPRFLAMCKIMRHADALGFKPADPLTDPRAADIPALVPAVAVQARPGTDLAALAKGLGMSWDEFADYNPAFRRYITPPDRQVSVYVPRHAEQTAVALLRDGKLSGHGWSTYVIARGDTMTKISRRTGVPIATLRQLNPRSEPLKAGARLRIPARAGTSTLASAPSPKAVATGSAGKASGRPSSPASRPAQAAAASHTVRRGETMASIARQYGVSLSALRGANARIANPNALSVGQKLSLPQGAKLQTASGESRGQSGGGVRTMTYKVKPGDTLWGIARKFNMPPDELLGLNNMSRTGTLRPGDSVRVVGN